MKTDKQLLALNKTDLLKEYRKLESKLQEVIKIVQDNDMIVRNKQHYNF